MSEEKIKRASPSPKLKNPKHELFAWYKAHGYNNTRAYRLAGYKVDDPAATVAQRTAASRLFTRADVRARVDVLIQERYDYENELAKQSHHGVTLAMFVKEMRDSATRSKARGNELGVRSAWTAIARAVGLYKEASGHEGNINFNFSTNLAPNDPNHPENIKRENDDDP